MTGDQLHRHSDWRSGPYEGQIGEVAYDHSTPAPRPVDRCLSCGRFVGRYPVGFYCDTHCSRCVCTRCPGFGESPEETL